MKILYSKFDPNKKIQVPAYATPHSSGLDLCSSSVESIEIPPNQYRLIPTNIVIELPSGYEAQVRPRSGLALNYGVTVLNSPGTIDSDYRGEIKVLLINFGNKPFTVNFGDRIAQLVVAKYEKIELVYVETLSPTERGTGGYGSTGIK